MPRTKHSPIAGLLAALACGLVIACVDDTISAPSGDMVTLEVNGGALETRSRAVTVRVEAPGADSIRVYDDRSGPVPFRAFADSIAYVLTPGDGPRAIMAQAFYAGGEVSAPSSDSIVLSEHAYASPGGDDASPGSYLMPKRSVGAAIAAAAEENRARVVLFPGRYAPSTTGDIFPIRPAARLTIEAAESAGTTILDAERTGGVVSVDGVPGVTLRGLTLTGGATTQGAGLFVAVGTVLAEGLIITGNEASVDGSGAYVTYGSLVLRWSIMAFNVSAPDSEAHGLEVVDGSAQIHNNVFAFHDSNGLIVRGSGAADIRNNIFYMNGSSSPTLRGRGICEVSSPHRTTIRYNLFFANQVAAVLFTGSGDLTAEAANELSPVDLIEGNLGADPRFVNALNGDFAVQPDSPARDAGDPDSRFNDEDGTRNDIGHRGGRSGVIYQRIPAGRPAPRPSSR